MTTDLPTTFQTKFVWGDRDVAFVEEIRLAAMSRVGVMITGPAERAEQLATEIHRRSHPRPPQILDGADEAALNVMLSNEAEGPLLLRNVDHLTRSSQSRLLAWTNRGHRIICWSAGAVEKALIPELFYRLNVVRIDLCCEH